MVGIQDKSTNNQAMRTAMAEGRVERRSDWNFIITDDGWLWAVTRPDGSEQRSARVFPTMKQCGDDAILHGYGAWRYDERRLSDVIDS